MKRAIKKMKPTGGLPKPPSETDVPNHYHLYAKVDGKWQWQCAVEGADHAAALKNATLALKPEHYDKPIRLEQEESLGMNTPPEPRHH